VADLLTHVLVAYVLATVLSWRYDWITPPLVTVAMVGAAVPDLTRVELLVPAGTIEAVLGVPFSWSPIHRVGGTALVVLLAGPLVSAEHRRRVLVLLALGAISHYALDAMIYTGSGLTWPMLWPLTDYRFEVSGFYRSSDRWPALVSGLVALVVWMASRRRSTSERDPPVPERR